jgi:hypothetical protein
MIPLMGKKWAKTYYRVDRLVNEHLNKVKSSHVVLLILKLEEHVKPYT